MSPGGLRHPPVSEEGRRICKAGQRNTGVGAGAHGTQPESVGFVQIAGIHDLAEARLLAACGVGRIAIPLRLEHHAEDLSELEAAAIVAELAREVTMVLVTYLVEPREIADLSRCLGVAAVQLHGDVTPGAAARLRTYAPDLRLVKSLVVEGGDLGRLRAEASAFEPFVDEFLTDSFDPWTGARGATGRTHDWRVSAELARQVRRPLVLAGGLNPANVHAAVLAVRPAGVDAHTGVEGSDGRKRRDLVTRFVSESRAAFSTLRPAARADQRRRFP